MIQKWIFILIAIVSLGVFVLFYVEDYSFSNDNLSTIEKIHTQIFPSDYSINSKCELYNLFMENSKGYGSLDLAVQAFAGYTPESIGIGFIFNSAREKVFYETYGETYDKFVKENPGGLAPHVDQSLVLEKITETVLTMSTDKAMITKDINPKLKSDVRELLNLLSTRNFEPILQTIDVCEN